MVLQDCQFSTLDICLKSIFKLSKTPSIWNIYKTYRLIVDFMYDKY